MIYFDNAATTFPKPPSVKAAVDLAMTRYGANPGRSGHDLSVETAKQVYGVRSAAAGLFGADGPEQVVFTQNCTYALNTVIHGLLGQGDHVIISDLEHNSVLRPVHALAQRGIITYSVAETSLDDEETVEAFASCIHPNTRAIVCTHGSNVFGFRLPVERLAKLAHERGLYLVVDAAQTAGCEPIDIGAMGIDFLCTAGHKGLYGPSGTGLLVTKFGERLRPLTEGGTGSLSADFNQPSFMPDRLESGTLNTAGVIGLGAGIAFLQKRGIEQLARYEMRVAREIYDALREIPGVLLYAPAPKFGRSLPVLSFNIEGMHSEEVTGQLNDAGFALRGGLHCAPLAHRKMGTTEVGAARISIGAFNTVEQGRDLAAAVEEIARKRK